MVSFWLTAGWLAHNLLFAICLCQLAFGVGFAFGPRPLFLLLISTKRRYADLAGGSARISLRVCRCDGQLTNLFQAIQDALPF